MNSRIIVIMSRFFTTIVLNYVLLHLEKVKHSCSIIVSHLFHRYSCLLDACEGDGGGPLMVFTNSKRWELIGITSYGDGCATEYPGVYTRVTAFLTWIQQFVNNISSPSSSHICSCECPRGSKPSTAYTTVNTAFACVDACKAVQGNRCNSPNFSVFTWSNGDRYEGQFKGGKMHGTGILSFSNGDKYIGDWVAGKRTGRGVYIWNSGVRYEGEFQNNMRTGHGNYTWIDGDRYEMRCS
jgi:hypothetical protein